MTIVSLPGGAELVRWDNAPDAAMAHTFQLTPDAAYFASGNGSAVWLGMWHLPTGRRRVIEVPRIEGHLYSDPWAVAVSPDGRYVAAGYGADMKDFWSEENRKRRESWGFSMLATRDLMMRTEAGHVRVWDVADGKERFMTLGHFALVQELVFSPDGRYLASRDEINMAKVWDVARGKPLNRLHGRITTMAFTPDGTRLVTGDEKGWVQFWEFVE